MTGRSSCGKPPRRPRWPAREAHGKQQIDVSRAGYMYREAVAEREAKDAQVVKANAAEEAARLARDRALGAERKAIDAADRAGRGLYSSLIDRARLEHQAANIAEAEAILDRCEPARRGWEWHFLKGLDSAEIFTLRGNFTPRGEVRAVGRVAWSPDGRWIATSGGGNPYFQNSGQKVEPDTVVLWDAATGRLVHTLRDYRHLIDVIAFTPDGRLIAAVRVWDVERGSALRVIRGHIAGVISVAFSPDGDRLVTAGSDDGTARVWDLNFDPETGASEIGLFVPHVAIEAIAFTRGGHELRSFARSGHVYRHASGSLVELGNIPTGIRVGCQTPCEPGAFDAVGRRVVAIHALSRLEAVCQDLDEGYRRTTLRGHSLEIAFATLSADGSRAATAAVRGDRHAALRGRRGPCHCLDGHRDLAPGATRRGEVVVRPRRSLHANEGLRRPNCSRGSHAVQSVLRRLVSPAPRPVRGPRTAPGRGLPRRSIWALKRESSSPPESDHDRGVRIPALTTYQRVTVLASCWSGISSSRAIRAAIERLGSRWSCSR